MYVYARLVLYSVGLNAKASSSIKEEVGVGVVSMYVQNCLVHTYCS